METKGKILKGIEIVFDEPTYSRDDTTDMFRTSPVCGNCMNFLSFNLLSSSEKLEKKCGIYPENIPEEIWLGKHDHTTHFKGDNGGKYKETTNKLVKDLLTRYIEQNGVKKNLALEIQNILK